MDQCIIVVVNIAVATADMGDSHHISSPFERVKQVAKCMFICIICGFHSDLPAVAAVNRLIIIQIINIVIAAGWCRPRPFITQKCNKASRFMIRLCRLADGVPEFICYLKIISLPAAEIHACLVSGKCKIQIKAAGSDCFFGLAVHITPVQIELFVACAMNRMTRAP